MPAVHSWLALVRFGHNQGYIDYQERGKIMCLTGTHFEASKDSGYIWKAFLVNGEGRLKPVYHDFRFVRGKWQKANKDDKDNLSYLGSRIGFHGFKIEKGA